LATIHSPELAETLRAYLSMRAELDAAHQRVTRLEGLVKIGAASQQELETTRAEHVRHATDVESAQAKLALLGVTAKQLSTLSESASIDSTIRVTSPIDGVITTRTINQGANIDGSMDLFTVVDLSSVWVMANLYERDLSRVRVGSTASITSGAAPGKSWSGRVSYIDPQLAQDTRTAKVRIDVNNPGRTLRLGMYTDVVLASSTPVTVLLIPRTAIQMIGRQAVVYIADPQQTGRYVERPVALGSASVESVEVRNGVAEGDQVVVAGSFALRAERDRLGFPPPATVVAVTPTPVSQSDAIKFVQIEVTKDGFSPTSVNVEAGTAVDLAFLRRTDETCAKEVVLPSLGVRRPLPLNERVSIRLAPAKAGTLAFVCGMNMLKGTVVVR
jgi:RND family efflux transporter MFP subunit